MGVGVVRYTHEQPFQKRRLVARSLTNLAVGAKLASELAHQPRSCSEVGENSEVGTRSLDERASDQPPM